VIEAAISCFETRGFDETTTATIAARAGVAVGTLYGYFRDKRELLLEILDRCVKTNSDRVVLQLDPESWRDIHPRDHVRAIIDEIFSNMGPTLGIRRVLFERYFKDPGFRAPFDAIRDAAHRAITQFIDALAQADAGSDTPLLQDIDRETGAFVILNAVQWNASQALMHGSPAGTEAVIQATTEMVSRYLFRER
jgi:AcrR family transcriptional regulator